MKMFKLITLSLSKIIDIGGLTLKKLEKKYEDKTISTPKEVENQIVLRTPTVTMTSYQGGPVGWVGYYLLWKSNPIKMTFDTESEQKLHIGHQPFINVFLTKEKEIKDFSKLKKPFPSLLLEKNHICFMLEYLDTKTDGSKFTFGGEEIDIYGSLFRK